MNEFQRLWWEQAYSDHDILRLLRRQRARPCHQLHYLQMVTEKLGKAYFWRKGEPPKMSHASFVWFLQALDDRPNRDRRRIASLLGFGRARSFSNWIRTVMPMAYELQKARRRTSRGLTPPTPNTPGLMNDRVSRRLHSISASGRAPHRNAARSAALGDDRSGGRKFSEFRLMKTRTPQDSLCSFWSVLSSLTLPARITPRRPLPLADVAG